MVVTLRPADQMVAQHFYILVKLMATIV